MNYPDDDFFKLRELFEKNSYSIALFTTQNVPRFYNINVVDNEIKCTYCWRYILDCNNVTHHDNYVPQEVIDKGRIIDFKRTPRPICRIHFDEVEITIGQYIVDISKEMIDIYNQRKVYSKLKEGNF